MMKAHIPSKKVAVGMKTKMAMKRSRPRNSTISAASATNIDNTNANVSDWTVNRRWGHRENTMYTEKTTEGPTAAMLSQKMRFFSCFSTFPFAGYATQY